MILYLICEDCVLRCFVTLVCVHFIEIISNHKLKKKYTNFAILLGCGCVRGSTPRGCTLPPPEATPHFGDRLAKTDGALHPLRRSLLRDRAMRDLGAGVWFSSSDTDASAMEGKCEEDGPPLPSNLRSEAGVLSMATLMGDGQAALLGSVMRPGEVVDCASQKPVYTAR